jgi:hypothetical protein
MLLEFLLKSTVGYKYSLLLLFLSSIAENRNQFVPGK